MRCNSGTFVCMVRYSSISLKAFPYMVEFCIPHGLDVDSRIRYQHTLRLLICRLRTCTLADLLQYWLYGLIPSAPDTSGCYKYGRRSRLSGNQVKTMNCTFMKSFNISRVMLLPNTRCMYRCILCRPPLQDVLGCILLAETSCS